MFKSNRHSFSEVRHIVAAGVTLVTGLLVSAPALGAVTHSVETQPNFALLSTTDSSGNLLVTGDLLTFSTPDPGNAAGHGNLNDDLLGDPNTVGNGGDGQSPVIGAGPYTYALFAPSNINQIRLYSGWSDSRAGQVIDVSVSTDGVNFSSLLSYNEPRSNVAMLTTVSDNAGLLATGVTHVRFDPLNANPGANDGPGTIFREFDVIGAFTQGFAQLKINRQTGAVSLDNASPTNIDIVGYSLTSGAGGFAQGDWTTIAGHYDATPANGGTGNGTVDGDDHWTVLTGAGSKSDLSEAEFDGGNGGTLAALHEVLLGTPWLSTPFESTVKAELLLPNGTIRILPVIFEGIKIPTGDLTGDGQITGADWTAFKVAQGSNFAGLSVAESYLLGDLDGDLDHDLADFGRFKTLFDTANGSGSFLALMRSANVPEPASFLMIAFVGITGLSVRSRRVRPAVAAAFIACIATSATSPMAHAVVTRSVERQPSFQALSTTDLSGNLLITNDLLKTATTSVIMPRNINNDILGGGVTVNDTEVQQAGNGPYTYTLAAPSNIEQIDVYTAWSDFRAGQDLTILVSSDGVNFSPLIYYKEPSSGNEVVLSTIRNNSGLLASNVTHIRFDPTDGATTGGAGGHYREIDVIAQGLAPKPMGIFINTLSGNITMTNQSAAAISFDSYQIVSPGGSLNPAGWSSLATRLTPVDGFPQGDGSGDGWEVAPNPSARELVEWNLTDETISTIGVGESINLSSAYNTGLGLQDLQFFYRKVTGEVVSGSTIYDDTPMGFDGDFNGDNRVDGRDFLAWQRGQSPNPLSAGDLSDWQMNYGMSALVSNLGVAGQAVPEPSSIFSLLAACSVALVLHQRRLRRGETMFEAKFKSEQIGMTACRFRRLAVAICVAWAAVGSTAQAAVYNERVYRLGDDPLEFAQANETVGEFETQFTGDTLDSGDPNSPNSTGFDPSGSYLDLRQTGNPIYVDLSTVGSGRTGLGVRFDGIDDRLNGSRLARPSEIVTLFPSYPINYTGLTARGIQAWAYIDELVPGQHQTLFWDAQLFGGPQISDEGKWTQANSNKYSDTANRLPTSVPVVDETWLHVMHHVYNATDPNAPRRVTGGAGTNHAAVVYVNGVAVSSTIDNLQANFNYAGSGRSGDLVIGAVEGNPSSFRNFFKGVLDDLKMYVFGNNETGTPGNLTDGENWGTFDLFADNDWIANEILTTVPGGVLAPGDVNKDGDVDGDDADQFVDNWLYTNLQAGALSTQTVGDWLTWEKGDMNHDGITNLADAYILNRALVQSGSLGLNFALLGQVPEPASSTLLGGMVAAGLMHRRRMCR